MTEFTIEGKIIIELTREIFRLNSLLLEAGNQLAAPVGLSSARWQILGIIEHGPEPVANIARIWRLTRQGVQQTADALSKDGFVEYLENPHHRRAKLVSITPKGTKALERIRRQQAIWANGIGEQTKLKDLQTVLAHLRTLKTILEQSNHDF
jgi:DNA-binding MarR family transcriptional regulator